MVERKMKIKDLHKDILTNGIKGRKFSFDEYEKGSTAKALEEVLSFADAIMID